MLGIMKKDNLSFLVFEIILLFLSVLLAFSLGKWQETQKEIQLAEIALSNLKIEIQKNSNEVEPLLEIHQKIIVDSYQITDSLLQNNSAWDVFNHILEGNDPRLPWVEKSAWEIAKSSATIQHIDYKLLTDISSLYNLQEKGIDQLFQKFTDHMAIPTFYNPEHTNDHLHSLQMILQSLYWNEKIYVEKCDSLLIKLEKY
jgi:hypothetical protein